MNKLLAIVVFFISCTLCACSKISESYEYSAALLRVRIGSQYGFINEKGGIAIEPQFDNAGLYFSNGVCFAELDGKKGLINSNGIFIVDLPDSVVWMHDFQNEVAIVRFASGSMNIIDVNGHFLLDRPYKCIVMNNDEDSLSFMILDWNDKWFVLDQNGEPIGEPCDSTIGFHHGLCPVKYNRKWGYINMEGKLVIDTIFDIAKGFSKCGLARVKKDNQEFFIDISGGIAISVNKALSGFECDRAAVEINDTLYLIDTTKRRICKFMADEMHGFKGEDSLATIVRNGKAIKIDISGNEILSTAYDNIGWFENGIAPVIKNGKLGIIDRQGKEIISLEYDDLFFPYIEGQIRSIIGTYNKDGVQYYDANGNLIGKDLGLPNVVVSSDHTKEEFVKYFDAKLADLSPLEGIYYVTIKSYYEDRRNAGKIGLNDSKSKFYAVVKDPIKEEYIAYVVDEEGKRWVNKFVRIGNTNNYAIVKVDKDNDYSSEGSMRLEDSNSFGFRLEQGHNNGYNFFVTYDFVRDYPSTSEIAKIQQAEWAGSGFAIADGYVVTNYHVTCGAKSIRVRGINGDMDKSYKAVVVAADKAHDLSIVRIVDKKFKTVGEIPYSIGKSVVDVGDDVFVLGFPMISSMGTDIKLTEGTISAASGYQGKDYMYQISAAIQPGNSGGPLFNEEGCVIGIVCGKHLDAEHTNYAIKISYLFSLINSSKLGITLVSNLKKNKLSGDRKKIKDYVYLIECSANY